MWAFMLKTMKSQRQGELWLGGGMQGDDMIGFAFEILCKRKIPKTELDKLFWCGIDHGRGSQEKWID